jgi:two-component system catabolic regulation response regulator CreB
MHAAPTVLVVEDDVSISDAVLYCLKREGMRVETVDTLAAARISAASVDVIILDLGLPDGSGFALLAELARTSSFPRVIVLTSRDEEVECVAALEAGADDFVAKPFSPRALVARVRAVLRRGDRSVANRDTSVHPLPTNAPRALPVTATSGLVVDVAQRKTTFDGADVPLTKIEFDLLSVLAEAPGRVRTRGELVTRVWGDEYALTERTVDSHFKALRRKFQVAGAPASLVETVRGIGFRLREEM